MVKRKVNKKMIMVTDLDLKIGHGHQWSGKKERQFPRKVDDDDGPTSSTSSSSLLYY